MGMHSQGGFHSTFSTPSYCFLVCHILPLLYFVKVNLYFVFIYNPIFPYLKARALREEHLFFALIFSHRMGLYPPSRNTVYPHPHPALLLIAYDSMQQPPPTFTTVSSPVYGNPLHIYDSPFYQQVNGATPLGARPSRNLFWPDQSFPSLTGQIPLDETIQYFSFFSDVSCNSSISLDR